MKSNKKVTVLLPSINLDFARQSIACLNGQTHENMEIVVSDNTEKGEIFYAKEMDDYKSSQSRVKLMHSFPETNGDPVKHHLKLIKEVKSEYFKFLFDDDLLSPISTRHLLNVAEQGKFPAVFHNRYVFENDGAEVFLPQSLHFKNSIYEQLSFSELATYTFSLCINIFSEPSFSLYHKSTIDFFQSQIKIGGLKVRYLGDVALPLSIAEKFGNVAISSARLGFFRRHPTQDSSKNSVVRLSGLVEWELISRYLNQRMKFEADLVNRNKMRIAEIYKKGEIQFPFLMDRYKSCIEKDKNYIVDDDFKIFFENCRKLQGLV